MTYMAQTDFPRLMGLDLSLTSTGVSINGETFTIKPKTKGVERLAEISDHIIDWANRVMPIAVIIEGYSYGSKFSRAHALGELGGSVKMMLYKSGFRIIEVPPKCRAKFATGNGNSGKIDVLASLKIIAPVKFSEECDDDECDAWVLEQMAYAEIGESPYKWSTAQMSALDKVDWAPLYDALKGSKQWPEPLP